MKTYCPKAFNSIFLSREGKYQLCCWSKQSEKLKKYTKNTTTPFKFFLSDEMEEIRNDMISGKRIDGCEYCYDVEDAGFKSLRNDLMEKHKFTMEPELHSIMVQLKIFGSSCNLSCYMCWPKNSTTKHKELKSIDTDIFDSELADDEHFSVDGDIVKSSIDEIIEYIDYVDNIIIIGGEPFLMIPHWKFLDHIPDDKKKNITITYCTNLFRLGHMQWHIDNYLTKFKKIQFSVSCDHFGEKLEWVRYPIDHKQFEDNLVKYRDTIDEIRLTCGMLNAPDIYEIYHYYKDKFDADIKLINLVKSPNALSMKNLPRKIKVQTNAAFDRLVSEGVKIPEKFYNELLKPRDEEEYSKFADFIQQLDLKRGTNANKTFGWNIYGKHI